MSSSEIMTALSLGFPGLVFFLVALSLMLGDHANAWRMNQRALRVRGLLTNDDPPPNWARNRIVGGAVIGLFSGAMLIAALAIVI